MLTYTFLFVSTLCIHSRRMAVLWGCFQDQLEKPKQAQPRCLDLGVGKDFSEFFLVDFLELADCFRA